MDQVAKKNLMEQFMHLNLMVLIGNNWVRRYLVMKLEMDLELILPLIVMEQ